MTQADIPIRKPHLTIGPPKGWADVPLRELWNYRDLLFTFAARDVKLRYRQTALGVIWVLLQPLLGAGIFTFVFGIMAKLPSGRVPYFVLAYAGMLAWSVFNSTLTKSSACVVGNSQLVSKVFFPRMILPLSTVLSALIDFAVGLALMLVMLVIYGINPGPALFLLPIWLLLAVLVAVGLGLLTSAVMVTYRDLQYVIPVLLQFLLYATPVAYTLEAVPPYLRRPLLANPMTLVMEGFRWSLLGHGHLSGRAMVYTCVFSVAVFLLGMLTFERMERRFADVI